MNTNTQTKKKILKTDDYLLGELCEAPVLALNNSLAARELELCTTKSLDDMGHIDLFASHAKDGLADTHTGNGADGLAKGTAHPSLQPIGTGTTQHFVDAKNMEGMQAHTHVECIFAACLCDVFVAANTPGF